MRKIDAAKVMEFGKITIPARLREKYHVRKGDYMLFTEGQKGSIIMRLVLPIERRPGRANPRRIKKK